MAIQQRSIDYAVEVDAILGLVSLIVTEAKVGKSPSEIAVECLPKLISVLSGIQQLNEELKANPKVVEQTVGYRLGEIVGILTA